ncbi:MAG: hypothetical protein V1885_03550 [Candidatus Brennerbacteria bacterium]
MRTLVTRMLWLAVACALLYGGFVAYERWWDGDLSFMKDRVLSFVSDKTDEVKGRAEEVGGEVLETVKEEATEQAKSAVSSLIRGAIGSIGEAIQKYGETVAGNPSAESAPAATGDTFSVPPPPVALTAKANAALSFVVNEGESYSAAWGDGAFDEGTKEVNVGVILRHAWSTPGDYTMTLITKANGNTRTQTFPIRIYE